MKKEKMLVFHSALAPYRIDQFNLMSQLFDLEVVFLLDNLTYFKYDQASLKSQCDFKISYLLKGPKYKSRYFRWGVFKKIKQSKPDFILSYEYSLTTQYIILLKSLGLINQKIGSMIDDSMNICLTGRTKLRKFVRDKTVKHLDFVVLLSQDIAHFYQENFKLKQEQTVVAPLLQIPEKLRKNKTELEALAERYIIDFKLSGKKVLLYVGRFSPEKALPLFLESVAEALAESEDILFVLVGEGREKEKLEEIVKERQLSGIVLFPGRFDGAELHPWYLCASGLILPSISETYGAVVDEALIFGLKVMCSQLAGASAIINSGNGIAFNPMDKDDTLDKFRLFVQDFKVVESVDMDSLPPLRENHREEFNKEWGKLIHAK